MPCRPTKRFKREHEPESDELCSFAIPYGYATWTDLPGEIRNAVYDFIIPRNVTFRIGTERARGSDSAIRERSCAYTNAFNPNVILLNKQTFAECASLLYRNRFDFYDYRALCLFLDRLRPQTFKLLTHITLTPRVVPTESAKKTAFNLLLQATNLQSITIDIDSPFKTDMGRPALFSTAQLASNFAWSLGSSRQWLHRLGENAEERGETIDRLLRLSPKAVDCALRTHALAPLSESVKMTEEDVQLEFRRVLKEMA